MKEPNERDDFIELLRLAYVAGSEAAESVVDKTELINHKSLQELKKCDSILIIQNNGPIHQLFKKYSTNNRIDNAKITEHENKIILEIAYTFHERKKKIITQAAFNAIKHVLRSFEEIKISTL